VDEGRKRVPAIVAGIPVSFLEVSHRLGFFGTALIVRKARLRRPCLDHLGSHHPGPPWFLSARYSSISRCAIACNGT
jgi:hypothetical protein